MAITVRIGYEGPWPELLVCFNHLIPIRSGLDYLLTPKASGGKKEKNFRKLSLPQHLTFNGLFPSSAVSFLSKSDKHCWMCDLLDQECSSCQHCLTTKLRHSGKASKSTSKRIGHNFMPNSLRGMAQPPVVTPTRPPCLLIASSPAAFGRVHR